MPAPHTSWVRNVASDVVNKYTMVGDVREQVAKREVDPRYPRFMLAPEATTKPGHTLLKCGFAAVSARSKAKEVALRGKTGSLSEDGLDIAGSPWAHLHLESLCSRCC